MDYIFFIQPSIEGHFGGLHVLVIVNNAAMSIRVRVCLKMFLSYLGKYPEEGLLGHMVSLFLVFLRNHHIVFHSGTSLHSL